MIWKPHATVAAVLEQEGRFLLVEERIGGEIRLNQPADHLEEGETLIEAAVRETIEEAGLLFRPTHLVGLYQWRAPKGNSEKIHPWIFSARLIKAHVRDGLRESTTDVVVRVGASCPKRETLNCSAFPKTGVTYLRAAFGGEIERVIDDAVLDTGILGPVWLTPDEARARAAQHRSPLVMACIEGHLAGRRHSLDLIRHLPR
ncbi:MAG: NUDIX domain-containing protein [Halothiobacillaceae bacterium]